MLVAPLACVVSYTKAANLQPLLVVGHGGYFLCYKHAAQSMKTYS